MRRKVRFLLFISIGLFFTMVVYCQIHRSYQTISVSPLISEGYYAPLPPPNMPDLHIALSESQRQPQSATAHYHLGIAYYTQHEYRKAIPELQRAIQIAPNTVSKEAYFFLGNSYDALYESKQAYAVFARLVQQRLSDADRSRAYLCLGADEWDVKEFEQAKQAYTQSLSYNSHQSGALFGMGCLAAKKDQWKEAADFLLAAVRYADTPHAASKAYDALGEVYEHQGKLENAEQEYRMALQSNSKNQTALADLNELNGK